MNASRIGLVFASLLLAGLFAGAAYAACPCVGDPDAMTNCATKSQGSPKGPNACSDTPDDLVGTDGQGCIEVPPTPVGAEGDDCTACVGGAVQSLNDDMELVLAKGCVCVADAYGTWTCISTNGINENGPAVPGVPPTEEELADLIEVEKYVTGDGSSWCEMRAQMACTADLPMM